MKTNCLTILLLLPYLLLAQMQRINHPNTIYNVAISDDGEKLAAAGKDSIVYVYAIDGKLVEKYSGFVHSIADVGFGANDDVIIAVDYAGTGYHIDLISQRITSRELHSDAVLDVNVLVDQNIIITTSRDSQVKIWKEEWEPVRLLNGHKHHTRQTVYIKEHGLISVADDKKIIVWSMDGQLKRTIDSDHQAGIWSVALDKKGRLYTADRIGRIIQWTYELDLARNWKAHDGPISELVIYGPYLISAGFDGFIKIWIDGALIQSLKAHDLYCSGIAIAEEKSLLISSGGDGQVKIWDMNALLN